MNLQAKGAGNASAQPGSALLSRSARALRSRGCAFWGGPPRTDQSRGFHRGTVGRALRQHCGPGINVEAFMRQTGQKTNRFGDVPSPDTVQTEQ